MNSSATEFDTDRATRHDERTAGFAPNQVIHGDCTQVLQALPSNSVDLVVTDPPYFVRYRDRLGRTIANDSGLMARAAREAVAATRKAAGDLAR